MSTSPTVSAADSNGPGSAALNTPASDRSPLQQTQRSVQEQSPALRALLYSGVAITVLSALGLALLLVSYFISLEPWPVFYWLGLFGLPLGFALMLGYVVAAAIARRRS